MPDGLVSYECTDGVAVIGLNRPEKRNAIDDALLDALSAAVARADAEAKAAVLFGGGDHFCAGLDLAEHVQRTPAQAIGHSRRWHAAFAAIERGALPYVCALQGAVVGGGLELAAATHIRVAEPSAFFALPEGQRGIFVGGGGSVRVARLMSAARMADLMLTGRVLSAEEGAAANLVQYLVAPGEALAKAKALAAAAAGNAVLSNYAILNALPRIQDMAQEDGLFVESLASALTQTSPEAKERLQAFLNKRAGKIQAPKAE